MEDEALNRHGLGLPPCPEARMPVSTGTNRGLGQQQGSRRWVCVCSGDEALSLHVIGAVWDVMGRRMPEAKPGEQETAEKGKSRAERLRVSGRGKTEKRKSRTQGTANIRGVGPEITALRS